MYQFFMIVLASNQLWRIEPAVLPVVGHVAPRVPMCVNIYHCPRGISSGSVEKGLVETVREEDTNVFLTHEWEMPMWVLNIRTGLRRIASGEGTSPQARKHACMRC